MVGSPGIELARKKMAEGDPILHEDDNSRLVRRKCERVKEYKQPTHKPWAFNQINGETRVPQIFREEMPSSCSKPGWNEDLSHFDRSGILNLIVSDFDPEYRCLQAQMIILRLGKCLPWT